MIAVVSPISFTTAAVGLSAIGALSALHLLRQKLERRRVASTIFWQKCAQQPNSNVPWSRRFHHFWTFMLLSLILLILSLALSADRWRALNDQVNVVVIDVGINMEKAGDDGKLLLSHAAEMMDADCQLTGWQPALIAAADQPLLLSVGNEPAKILRRHLTAIPPCSSASSSLLSLDLAGTIAANNHNGSIDWYTDQTELPAGLAVKVAEKVRIHSQLSSAKAVAIVGVNYESRSNDPPLGSLRVRIGGQIERPVKVTLSNNNGILREMKEVSSGDSADAVFEGIPADGSNVEIELDNAPGAAVTHQARFQLPRCPPLKFYLLGDIPRPLLKVLTAIGKVSNSPQDSVVVMQQGYDVPKESYCFIEVRGKNLANGAKKTLTISDTWQALGQEIDLEGATAVGNVSESSDNGTPLVYAGNVPMASWIDTPDGRGLWISAALLDESADFPRRAAFPVIMTQIARSLAGWQSTSSVILSSRIVQDPVWLSSKKVSAIYDTPKMLPGNYLPMVPAALPAVGFRADWRLLLLASGLVMFCIDAALWAQGKII